jgi:hypothetical protein
MSEKDSVPRLSVILYAANGLPDVTRTIAHLRAQEESRMELVLLVPKGTKVESGDFQTLSGQIVEVEPGWPSAFAWSRGVQAARGPVVAFAEDHSFVQEGWAQALLTAHEKEELFAVGPAVENANPGTSLSWADFALNFLEQFLIQAGGSSRLCGHNTSYKKEALLALQDSSLEEILSMEHLLHQYWGPDRCFQEPRARVSHVNISTIGPFLRHKVLGGLVFGGYRCARWSLSRRVLYLAGAWLIPVLRGFKIGYRMLGFPRQVQISLISALPWIGVALVLHAAGEGLGYLFGPRIAEKAYRSYTLIETNRWDMVNPSDRRLKE